jgi:CO dehydrogenase maturation factor
VLAICGKGGVGKTAVSALLARALLEQGRAPLLLVDADPVGGFMAAVGARPRRTLAEVRAELVSRARQGGEATRQALAGELDYRLLEALCEREDHALLAMGRSGDKGCFCPANAILREALDDLSAGFAAVLVDAEAGVEQIQREVTRRVGLFLVVLDGSARSRNTLTVITELCGVSKVAIVENRVCAGSGSGSGFVSESVPLADVPILGRIPQDEALARFDRAGRPLWELPADNPALAAASSLAGVLWARWEALT